MPFLEDLHAVVGHHVQLGVLEDDEVLFIERLSNPGAVINVTRIAGRLPLHASSSGLVLLANASADLQDRILRRPLTSYTANTISDPKTLRTVLAEIRRTGVAVCPGFIHDDALGIAVPLKDSAGGVAAALSVIVPCADNPMAHIPALQAAAHGIRRELGRPLVPAPPER